MAEPGQGEEMSKEEFDELCDKAYEGKTAEILAAVDQNRRLATRAQGNGMTLLISALGAVTTTLCSFKASWKEEQMCMFGMVAVGMH